MPHYKDGTEVQIGDHVFGHLANTEGVVAGTVVSITPGGDACSAKVRFTKTGSAGAAVDMMPTPPRMPVGRPELAYSRQHGSSGPLITIWACEDYADTDKLTKVG
jgi:hypothetical protein